MPLEEKHGKLEKREGQVWAVQPVRHEGAAKVVIELADSSYVYVKPATAIAFGRALIAAAQLAAEDDK